MDSKIHDIGWAAGFVEGEAHIGFIPQDKATRKYPRLKLNVTQTDRQPLDMLKLVLGCGEVRGPYGPYSGNRKPHFQFNVSGQAAVGALEKLLPYLFAKGEQARSAMEQYKEYCLGR